MLYARVRWTVLATLHERLTGIDPKPAVLVVQMALAAGVEEHRPDLRVEEVRLFARRDHVRPRLRRYRCSERASSRQ